MELDIALFAGLRCANPDLPCCGETGFRLEVPSGTTIRALRDMLGIDPAIPLLVMVNNHHEPEESVLRADDRVAMFPPIGGG
ncbi:MoaD/ThiS family protein [Geotalea uraniireducens]|uniref:ThiamineS protein n=1 Tax=Geotalea uraniireducens (strain Rf4) TaxID=351605 RepID=A5G7D5_GEOUR|nr:MoaD/ThiS family protein [Geotalea uraniireducens]ABQ27703.1 thiamineS protein [Geotalea uraniireducens Rf4]